MLKVPATQRHHREHDARARWVAISKVRFLYGLPTYSVRYWQTITTAIVDEMKAGLHIVGCTLEMYLRCTDI